MGAPLGRLQLLEGQVDMLASSYARAYEHFVQAAEELPESVAAQSLLARCCITRHFFRQGEEVYRRCESLRPATLEDYLYLAQVEAFYDAEKATETLNVAVRRSRASLVARLIRGDVLIGRAHDTADPALAEAALADYRIATELLGNTPLVTSGHMRALLAAASAYEVHGEAGKREQALQNARHVAKQLAEFNSFRAQKTLAFYHDYVGDVEQAIAEMRKFDDRQVLYLVLTLMREERYHDAIAACENLEGGPRTNRQLSFFRALIAATSGKSPTDVRNIFAPVGAVKLNPIHELLSVYTISRLVDSDQETYRQCQALARHQTLPAFRKGWLPHLARFACGEISAEQLRSAAGTARKNLCEANYYIALAKLAAGNRKAAAKHFQASIDTGVFNYIEYYLRPRAVSSLDSRFAVARLDRGATNNCPGRTRKSGSAVLRLRSDLDPCQRAIAPDPNLRGRSHQSPVRRADRTLTTRRLPAILESMALEDGAEFLKPSAHPRPEHSFGHHESAGV